MVAAAPTAAPSAASAAATTRSPPSFDWTADGSGLVFGSRGTLGDDAGLRLLDLASGAWRTIEYAATRRRRRLRAALFARWPLDRVRAQHAARRFLAVPATGGTAQRLSRLRADIRGWDWTPDGRGIVARRWNDSESRLYRLDLDSGAVARPRRAPTASQPAIAGQPAGAGLRRSSATTSASTASTCARGGRRVERLFPSSGRDRLPAIAPDGRQLVFTSDRSGQFGLWWADLEPARFAAPHRRRAARVAAPAGLVAGQPHAAGGRLGRRRRASALHEVAPASGRVTRLASPGPTIRFRPLYLPGTGAPDETACWWSPASSGGRLRLTPVRPQRPALAGAGRHRRRRRWSGSIAPTGALLFTRSRPGRPVAVRPGAVRRPACASSMPQLPMAARYRQWAVSGDGQLYFIDRSRDCAARAAPAWAAAPRRPAAWTRARRRRSAASASSPRDDAAFVTLSEWVGWRHRLHDAARSARRACGLALSQVTDSEGKMPFVTLSVCAFGAISHNSPPNFLIAGRPSRKPVRLTRQTMVCNGANTVGGSRAAAAARRRPRRRARPSCVAVRGWAARSCRAAAFSIWVQLRGSSWVEAKEGKFRLRRGDWIALEKDSKPLVQADRHGVCIGLTLSADALRAIGRFADCALYAGRGRVSRARRPHRPAAVARGRQRGSRAAAGRAFDAAPLRPILLHLAGVQRELTARHRRAARGARAAASARCSAACSARTCTWKATATASCASASWPS